MQQLPLTRFIFIDRCYFFKFNWSQFPKTPNIEKLFIDSTVIDLTEKVRDLGVILDKNLTLTYHINETCR